MKKKILNYMFLLWALVLVVACSREKFAELNTNPDDVLSIPPEYELQTGLYPIQGNEQYYDYNLAIYYWSQTFVLGTGNGENSYQASGNVGQRWGNFYGNVGNRLVDIKELINKLPVEKQAAYVHLKALVDIPLAFYAWYTSDVYSSIPYTEAFKARYTIPSYLTPKYDTQETLYGVLDNQLKAAITVLKAPQSATQVNLTGYDIYFDGNITKWIKTANSLRLLMAMRLIKRSPEKLKAIATEVLGDNVGLISSIDEDWKFIPHAERSNSGDLNPSNQRPVSGSKNMVDFMWKTQDPRTRIFFEPSHFTKARFDSAQAQGKIPASFVWDGQLYRGQFVSPDARLDPAKAVYFTTITYSFNGTQVTNATLPSPIRSRLFRTLTSSNGDGNIAYPLITYADVCFMLAELAQRNIAGTDAQAWYYKGIDASLAEYDKLALLAKVPGYVPLTSAEILTYKAQPGIVYDPANALEQICVQQYINSYKNNNEAWATIKRTGFPSPTGNIMKLEPFINGGSPMAMPRRFSINPPSLTDLNATNIQNAIEDMQKNVEGFGSINDITGRVWWDKP